MKLFLFLCLIFSFNLYSDEDIDFISNNKSEFLSKEYIDTLQKQYPDSDVSKLLKELEEHESYRMDTCGDMSRNPFHGKRYKFNFDN